MSCFGSVLTWEYRGGSLIVLVDYHKFCSEMIVVIDS